MNVYDFIIAVFFVLLLISFCFATVTVIQLILDKHKLNVLKSSPLLNNSWIGEDAVFIILFYFATSFIASLIPGFVQDYIQGLPGTLKCDESLVEYTIYLSSNMLFMYIPGIFICISLVSRFQRKLTYKLLSRKELKRDIFYGCLSFLKILAPVMLASFISVYFLSALGYKVGAQDILSTFSKSNSIIISLYIALIAIVIGPIFEEFIFRGVLLQYFLNKVSMPIAVFVVSAIFAGIHYHIPSFLPLFILACGMSIAYIRSGSIVVPITMHVLFNAVNLLVLLATNASELQ